MEFDETNFKQLQELARSGKVLIGIHTAGATDFFDKTKKEMEEAIGESIPFERNVVLCLSYLYSIIFYGSIFFAIVAFGWWAILAIAVGFGLQSFRHTFSQLGIQRISLTIILFAIATVVVFALGLKYWATLWALSILIALFLDKLKFYAAHHLLRSLVIKNYRAFALLNGTIVSLKSINIA